MCSQLKPEITSSFLVDKDLGVTSWYLTFSFVYFLPIDLQGEERYQSKFNKQHKMYMN